MDKPVTLILGLGQLTGEAVARRFNDAGHSVIAHDPSMKRVEIAPLSSTRSCTRGSASRIAWPPPSRRMAMSIISCAFRPSRRKCR